MKILINNQNEKSLKAILIEKGYSFPCGGKGICGKCKIIADSLEVTPLDKTFLSTTELEKGFRLACDKTIDKPIVIDCLLEKKVLEKPLRECDLVIVFNKKSMIISVYSEDGHIIDHEIAIDEELTKQKIISYIAKESIELMEFYKVPKATTILISGTNNVTDIFEECSFDGSLYNLPCEDVYVLKGKEKLGSNIILELLGKENALYLIERDDNLYINILKDSEIVCMVLEKTNLKKQVPFVKNLMDTINYGMFLIISDDVDVAFLDKEFLDSFYIKPLYLLNASNCLLNNRSKSAYRNLLRKIVLVDKNWEFEF